MKTEQEVFWQSEFGTEYTDRNNRSIGANIHLFSKVFSRMAPIGSAFEIGCNRGLNLDAIRALRPDIATSGIEINEYSRSIAVENGHKIALGSVLDATVGDQAELVFTRGVLIHINPESLPAVYDFMHAKSRRYLLVDEYFSPTPVSVPYRDHQDRLFKRDFAKELMNRFQLRLVDYGFTWKEDPVFPLDNSNWFLFEKTR